MISSLIIKHFPVMKSLIKSLIMKFLDDAKVVHSIIDEEEVFHYRMDNLWSRLSNLTMHNSSAKLFKYRPRLVEIFLVLSHSNAELEFFFNVVRKNKTDIVPPES